MELIRGIHNLKDSHRGSVLTIGNFDGVHRGHQSLLRQLIAKARELDAPAMLIVFEPQPGEYFAPERAPARLSRFREKAVLLSRLGIDLLMCLAFNDSLARVPPETITERFLARTLRIRHMMVGDDFRFGSDRRGSYQMLATAGEKLGYGVGHMETRKQGGLRISSTAIRTALQHGDLDTAALFLGRPYSIMGRVGRGRGLGNQIGVPTANIRLHRLRTALAGTFVVRVLGLGRKPAPAVANLGIRPTVAGTEQLLEIHLLDFSGDLYGHQLEVQFLHKIRAEKRFASITELVAQIGKDIAVAKTWLHNDG